MRAWQCRLQLPALSLHPGNAVTDRLGKPRVFDATAFEAFQDVLGAFGPADAVAEKRRIQVAVRSGADPRNFVPAASRSDRHAARVGLRQMLHTESGAVNLEPWLEAFDRDRGIGPNAAVHSESARSLHATLCF